ncbi:hypothetical protein TWF481_001955 [Arthrobotrys musiformis]|uniref:Uncharacterized protein n=1 Tax=Arthrobotrys musiformis TaxID=47236 RepID=A0AAV9VWL2_9PEZI
MQFLALFSILALAASTFAAPYVPSTTCPRTPSRNCAYICGQVSTDSWSCTDKIIFPDPTTDNFCIPCNTNTPLKRSSPLSSRATDIVIKLDTKIGAAACPKKKDQGCAFICGRRGVDILFCAKRDIHSKTTAANKGEADWCVACS